MLSEVDDYKRLPFFDEYHRMKPCRIRMRKQSGKELKPAPFRGHFVISIEIGFGIQLVMRVIPNHSRRRPRRRHYVEVKHVTH